MPLVEIKDFNALIDNKPFFDQPVKSKQEAYEKLIEMSRNDDYTTGNLLYYSFHQNYYKFIGVDLPRQKKKQIFLNKLMLQKNWKKKIGKLCNNVSFCAAKKRF